MNLLRVFIAIPLPAALRNRLIAETEALRAEIAPKSMRWVPAQNIHITLNFLGDVEENRLETLERHLAAEMENFSPFSLSLGGLGVFPHKNRPKVIWLGVEKNKNLLLLHRRVQAAASKIESVPKKSPFSAHITLGRVTRYGHQRNNRIQIQKAVKKNTLDNFGKFNVEAVHLFQSELTAQGAIYHTLFQAKLGVLFE